MPARNKEKNCYGDRGLYKQKRTPEQKPHSESYKMIGQNTYQASDALWLGNVDTLKREHKEIRSIRDIYGFGEELKTSAGWKRWPTKRSGRG